MQVVTQEFIKNKKVLLRYDIDVALRKDQGAVVVEEDFKLRAGIPTLNLCLQNAASVVMMGHIGRPEGKVVEELSVAPIKQWLVDQGLASHIESGKLKLLENLRFDPRESFDWFDSAHHKSAQDKEAVMEYAKELACMGEVYVNEAFSSYRPAVSTTILPTLLPHAAGLRFAEEVRKLTEVRDHPKKPFVVIMGGAKVTDKLPVIEVLAGKADAVLVGGKLVSEIREQNLDLPKNVMKGMLNEDGLDIAPQTVEAWSSLISQAAMIVWNGPMGRIEDPNFQFSILNFQKSEELGSERGSYEIAKLLLESQAEIVVGGGDTIAFLNKAGLLGKFEKAGLVSVGGGAMLKFLIDGTLPTIEALT